MDNNELLHKLTNNKKILYIFPHLIYVFSILSSYYRNREILFFKNIFIIILIFFIITFTLQIILKKIIKKDQYVFYIMFFICFSYQSRFDWLFLLEFFICAVIIFIILIKSTKLNFNNCIGILIFVIGTFLLMTVPKNLYSTIKLELDTKRYNEKFNVNVSNETENPNIYWIHCDAMMSFDTVKKYFEYDNLILKYYLNKEKFFYNSNAHIEVDHKTQKALASLFNPNYYDNFLKKHLNELEEVYLNNKDNPSYNISAKELVDKRFNNELMIALKEKGYTTVGITKFNNYSSVKTDILYDYYNFSEEQWHFPKNKELRRMLPNEVKKLELNYNYMQIKEYLSYTVLSPLIDNYIPFKHESIDYNNLDTSNYSKINNSEYWQAKAILKSIDETKNLENKFVFIDYDLNHPPFAYDAVGNKLSENHYYHLNSYLGTYVYSSNILIDIVNYIKDNDKEAIIILQGDHGIHTIPDEHLIEYLDVNNEEIQEIRNSVINAVYIPDKYQNGEEKYLSNPLNISRYLVNNFVGKNYEYIEN